MLSPLSFPLDRVVDTEGRPLFEGRASREMQAIAPLEHAVCPYPGSRFRHEKPMNVSGLRQMSRHWDDVMAGLQYLRALYPQPAPHIRYIDLWRICNLGEHLTAYLLYRRHEPVQNGQLPGNVAGVFKIVIGLIAAAQQLAFLSVFQGPEKIDEPLDHDQLYAFVEESQLFIGPKEVCAGPETMIREVVNVIRSEAIPLDPAQQAKLALDDPEAFLRFSYARMNGVVLTFLYSILAESLYARIVQALGANGGSAELLTPADPHLALLAAHDAATGRAILEGIGAVAISDAPEGRLAEGVAQLSRLCGEGAPSPRVRESLGRHAQNAGVVDDVARYLQLEKISADLSLILKQQALEALGLKDQLYLNAISGLFVAPESKLRSLAHLAFDLQVPPNLHVQYQNRTLMALHEDPAWSA